MHLVDGEPVVYFAGAVDGAHGKRMDDAYLGARQAALEFVLAVVVGEEADRAAVHPVDWDAVVHVPVQGLQHQAVAPERDDGVGPFGRNVAVDPGKPVQSGARLWHLAGDERDLLEFFW